MQHHRNSKPVLWAWEYADPEHSPPAEIGRVEAFLNTVDHHRFGAHADKPEGDRDLMTDAGSVRAWLVDHDLLPPDDDVTMDDLAAVRSLRDALRGLVSGEGVPSDEALGGLRLRVRLEPPAALAVPAHHGVAGALERLLADVVVASATGALQRLKICQAEDCRFAYYDHSRSRTSRWCSMETCGNRVKTRRYRRRAAR